MDLVSLILSFHLQLLFGNYNAEYAECPIINYETCNGLQTRETNFMIYNNPGIQIVRLGIFYDERIKTPSMHALQVMQLNRIFEKSGVNIRVEVAFSQSVNIESYYNEDILPIYYDLADWEYSYPFAEYSNLIYENRADFVHLFLSNRATWNACGVGKKFDGTISAGITACYSDADLVLWDPEGNISSDHTFAHELGHQFGLEHDEPNATAYPFIEGGYGLQVNKTYGTIMSYAKRRVPYYSNPRLQIDGVKYGDETANAVQALNELAPRLSLNFEEYVDI